MLRQWQSPPPSLFPIITWSLAERIQNMLKRKTADTVTVYSSIRLIIYGPYFYEHFLKNLYKLQFVHLPLRGVHWSTSVCAGCHV